MPSGVHPAVHVPDVVEWIPVIQIHSTVSPTPIVDVLVPLTRSTNELPLPGPTSTTRLADCGGVGVGVVPVPGGVGVDVAAPGGVAVSVGIGPVMLSSSSHAPAVRRAAETTAIARNLRIMEHLRG
jgi:hypothetical protein